MNEERWGEQWKIGQRIRYSHPDPDRNEIVDGVIKDRHWGRDKGEPIFHFSVLADNETDQWIVDPKHIQPDEKDASSGDTADHDVDAGPQQIKLPPPELSPAPKNQTSADGGFPEPRPEKSGFGPDDAEEEKQWRKRKAVWARERGL
ncbi:hypothetical protein [Arthrobacter sp. YN]|uniref:hypothetical protein n=1 Tax=Arthrobacter sp. YN TaxID=2020486 RepID=UPI000B620BF3|nr:hypothetical protein [Arthrobacter sp. YN]ASN20120.1 hypothetical protein CGK93_10910 [Arthrobacter sp. YN]